MFQIRTPFITTVAATFLVVGFLGSTLLAPQARAQLQQPGGITPQPEIPEGRPGIPGPDLSGDLSVGKPEVDAGYDGRLQSLDEQFQQIVQGAEEMIQQETKENPSLEEAMFAYAEGMKEVFQRALDDAKKAAESEGMSGNEANLQAFEKIAQQHEERLQQLAERAQSRGIDLGGGIQGLNSGTRQLASPDRNDNNESFLSALSGLFISNAEARVARECVAPCWSQNWRQCMNCVVRVGPEATSAWNEFVRCWRESSWFWHRVGCLRDLVFTLA